MALVGMYSVLQARRAMGSKKHFQMPFSVPNGLGHLCLLTAGLQPERSTRAWTWMVGNVQAEGQPQSSL